MKSGAVVSMRTYTERTHSIAAAQCRGSLSAWMDGRITLGSQGQAFKPLMAGSSAGPADLDGNWKEMPDRGRRNHTMAILL
jgi:hypothetical protein